MATFQLSKKQIVIFLAVVVFLLTLLYGQRFADSNDQDDKEFALAVPFTTQAPTGDWEGNENCEEASAIMANAYLTGNTSSNLDPREVNKTINNLIDWENANLGHHADTGIDDTAKMVESAFQLKTKKIYNFTEEDLKRELKDNHVLLLPINARMGNMGTVAKFLAPGISLRAIRRNRIDLHHIRIFPVEKMERSGLFRLRLRHLFTRDRQILPNLRIHLLLDGLYLFRSQFPREREIKSRPLRGDIGTFLAHLVSQGLAERLVEQVGCRMKRKNFFKLVLV